MLRGPPVSCGRSPVTLTGLPSRERVPLKKLLLGLIVFDRAEPLNTSASPGSCASPFVRDHPKLRVKAGLRNQKTGQGNGLRCTTLNQVEAVEQSEVAGRLAGQLIEDDYPPRHHRIGAVEPR